VAGLFTKLEARQREKSSNKALPWCLNQQVGSGADCNELIGENKPEYVPCERRGICQECSHRLPWYSKESGVHGCFESNLAVRFCQSRCNTEPVARQREVPVLKALRDHGHQDK
jgi:hypothetical protein